MVWVYQKRKSNRESMVNTFIYSIWPSVRMNFSVIMMVYGRILKECPVDEIYR